MRNPGELSDDEVEQLADDLRRPLFVMTMAKPGQPGADTRRRNALDQVRGLLSDHLNRPVDARDKAADQRWAQQQLDGA